MKRSPLSSPWVVILAGGASLRLRPLTQQISGDQRPKQFCPILDGETLLDRTRRRAALLVPEERHVIVVSRPHEMYFGDLRAMRDPARVLATLRGAGARPAWLSGAELEVAV